MQNERAFAIAPIVQESVQHNLRTLSNIRALSSVILGLCAGLLHLESLWGFGFYLLGNAFVSILVYAGPLRATPTKYLFTAEGAGELLGVLMSGGVIGMESVMGFVMCWTVGYAVVEG